MGVGAGFLFLVFGHATSPAPDFKVGLWWLAGLYLIHSIAELCISPVGLSMITKLSIARIVGLMMGVWFLSISVRAICRRHGRPVRERRDGRRPGHQPQGQPRHLYRASSRTIGLVAIGIGVVLFSSPGCSRSGCMASNRASGLSLAVALAARRLRLAGCAAKPRRRSAAPLDLFNDDPYPVDLPPLSGRADGRSAARPSSTARAGGSTMARSCSPTASSRRSAGRTRRSRPARSRSTARGKWVTPGHHRRPQPSRRLSEPRRRGASGRQRGDRRRSRPDVWAEHSVWPQDPGFSRALANGGVTALQILPGSANLFGGRSVTLKNVPARTVQGMKFPGAPYGLKMACGENPKRVYGGRRADAVRPAWAISP